ncbi:Fibrillin-3 [Senna tora]|uniref:Fibrillin-3 n=1 Tax=Senna tora TaxID=362788 RepID=A0A834WWV0_9FABA|nr:Fibrillin-3 [Senna tora]
MPLQHSGDGSMVIPVTYSKQGISANLSFPQSILACVGSIISMVRRSASIQVGNACPLYCLGHGIQILTSAKYGPIIAVHMHNATILMVATAVLVYLNMKVTATKMDHATPINKSNLLVLHLSLGQGDTSGAEQKILSFVQRGIRAGPYISSQGSLEIQVEAD